MADRVLSQERKLVEDVLTPTLTAAIWTRNCEFFFPAVQQDFQLGAVLPIVLYAFRWGRRRGLGRFVKTFAKPEAKQATVSDVAQVLVSSKEWFDVSKSPAGNQILADLLLAYCLQNKKKEQGHQEKVLRVYCTHYYSTWLDLPQKASDVRLVPETVLAMLVQPDQGRWLKASTKKSHFPMAVNAKENCLLSLFSQGVDQDGAFSSNATGDRFDESATLGIDQLLVTRIAQAIGEPPSKGVAADDTGIPSRLPLGLKHSRFFREDFSAFLGFFAESIPRLALLPMIEAALSIGLATSWLASVQEILSWERSGCVKLVTEQEPLPLFVDCSNGTESGLRLISEETSDALDRAIGRLPALLMCVRLLDQQTASDRKLRSDEKLMGARNAPWPGGWLNVLGDVLHGRSERSDSIFDRVDELCSRLAETLTGHNEEWVEILRNQQMQENPFWRLSEVLCQMRGTRGFHTDYASFFESCANVGSQSALCVSRRVKAAARSNRLTRVVRSIVLTDPVLDYLVHRHLLKNGKKLRQGGLSYSEFLRILRERYGFFVDKAPPGAEVSAELLKRNGDILERRLRDLGLLVGVNDAESMKRLRARFEVNPAAEERDDQPAATALGGV